MHKENKERKKESEDVMKKRKLSSRERN